MAPFFLDLSPVPMALVNVAIGIGFGFVLERAGFGNANKLAAQFYLGEQRVLKVMFTAIITAMCLIFASAAVGIIDFERIALNETHLWPAIIGGLILGVGFIVGGYCPGTSVVAAATLKLDGLVFLLGCLFGIFVFGQTFEWVQGFWETAGAAGRVTIPQWLGLSNGIVVLAVILMALGMFLGAEVVERWINNRDGFSLKAALAEALATPRRTGAVSFAAFGMLLAGWTLVVPDPSEARRLSAIEAQLALRERHIDPAELLKHVSERRTPIVILDVRDEADYNLFHIADARRVDLAHVEPAAKALPDMNVKVLVCNDETRANAAYRTLAAARINNVYILEGGVNGWLARYGHESPRPAGAGELRYAFTSAAGGRNPAAHPDVKHAPPVNYTPKIRLARQAAAGGGGCGA